MTREYLALLNVVSNLDAYDYSYHVRLGLSDALGRPVDYQETYALLDQARMDEYVTTVYKKGPLSSGGAKRICYFLTESGKQKLRTANRAATPAPSV